MAQEETWRLLFEDEAHDCYYNMGLDKAILNSVSAGDTPPTIRFYRWLPSAVSIGYFQSMRKVVNIAACEQLDVDYIRRVTGGGAVYHDFEGELTYSVNCPTSHPKISEDITKIYERICGGIVKGLATLGIKSEFKPINDIILSSSGRKISGSALTRKQGVILQHGTILRKVNVERMFSLLVVPDEKIKDKLISSAKERVSSLEQELGSAPSFAAIRKALIAGLEEVFDITLVRGALSNAEASDRDRIASSQFKNKEWLFKR